LVVQASRIFQENGEGYLIHFQKEIFWLSSDTYVCLFNDWTIVVDGSGYVDMQNPVSLNAGGTIVLSEMDMFTCRTQCHLMLVRENLNSLPL